MVEAMLLLVACGCLNGVLHQHGNGQWPYTTRNRSDRGGNGRNAGKVDIAGENYSLFSAWFFSYCATSEGSAAKMPSTFLQ